MDTEVIYCGDNLEILAKFPEKSIDLIYADPPFYSGKPYEMIWKDNAEMKVYEDRWKGGINVYIEWMKDRLYQCHRVLKDIGTMYLHCDWHANHKLRVTMDDIFGEKNFRNEIIWHYDIGGKPKYDFRRKHDTILRYSKGKEVIWNEIRLPPLNPERYDEIDEEGRQYYIGYGGKWLKYLDSGTPADDVWTFVREPQFRTLNSQADERLGYPTQKPEPLLKRIIEASSNKNDVVLDPFCGCGTTLAVAQQINRKWIGIDVSPIACSLVKNRLGKLGATDKRK